MIRDAIAKHFEEQGWKIAAAFSGHTMQLVNGSALEVFIYDSFLILILGERYPTSRVRIDYSDPELFEIIDDATTSVV